MRGTDRARRHPDVWRGVNAPHRGHPCLSLVVQLMPGTILQVAALIPHSVVSAPSGTAWIKPLTRAGGGSTNRSPPPSACRETPRRTFAALASNRGIERPPGRSLPAACIRAASSRSESALRQRTGELRVKNARGRLSGPELRFRSSVRHRSLITRTRPFFAGWPGTRNVGVRRPVEQ